MATWVTHLMIADSILAQCPAIHRRGFCVGSIAPDCNVENEDWTAFTPSRERTHWMRGESKTTSDADAFCEQYLRADPSKGLSDERYAFLLGYYAHLLTDVAYACFLRDPARVAEMWKRIEAADELCVRAQGCPRDWDAAKKLLPKAERLREIHAMEAAYLREHPASGYLTEILLLKGFPDYLDYLPRGCIVRKIGVMGYLPQADATPEEPIGLSREEFARFHRQTSALVLARFREQALI